MSALNGKIALVTGASRGVGAATAHLLAQGGADVFLNYRSKTPRAESVADEIRALGRQGILVQADIVEPEQVREMFATVQRDAGQLDILVLNASGGMEKGKTDDYSLRLNRDAQINLLDQALPLIPSGGRIVFVTSHHAHFYPEKPVLPVYEPVAAGKRAGEDALRARISELTAKGVSLIVVSGDMIEGTITPKLMERAERGTMEKRRQQAGRLITVDEFAAAIVEAAGSETLRSGDTVYVGQVD